MLGQMHMNNNGTYQTLVYAIVIMLFGRDTGVNNEYTTFFATRRI